MNLVCLAALVAVCGAAKLDRTYLPPASAKTAGGSAGALQTPFAGNSVGDNTGLPKGSYTNDFQGVVVDAAAAGTRSGEGETGLGAPRISYGSTNSKVGDAAFRGTSAAGFRPFPASQNFNRQSEGQNFDGQNGQGENLNSQGQIDGQAQGVDTDGQTASSQVQSAAQGFQRGPNAPASQFQGNRGASVQAFAQGNRGENTQASAQFQGNRGSFESKPERAQAAFDRTASILRYENDVGPESYHYAFETDNGISAEENGVATNGVQAQGGFSYTGDDGQIYTVTYTADEGGYQPRGDHLPTPPPIPEEILKSLAKNARDEAAGLVDDGSYDAQKYNAGGDYAESDGSNVGHNDRHTPNFGKRPDTDATASGTFINQNNQPFAGQDGSSDSQNVPSDAFGPSNNANVFGQSAQPTEGPAGNAFGPSASNGFRQTSQANVPSSSDAFGPANNFGQVAQPSRAPSTNGFGPSSQSGAPIANNAFSSSNNFGQSEPSRAPSASGFEQSPRPSSPSASDAFGPSNNFGQRQPSRAPSTNSFGSRKEYLPPVNGFNQNGRPQRPITASAQASAGFNGISQASGIASSAQPQNYQGSQLSSSFGKPNSNRPEVSPQPTSSEPQGNNGFESAPQANNFAQGAQPTQPSAQTFGSRSEYLPPSFGQNSRPQRIRPQSFAQSADATAAPSFNSAAKAPGAFQSTSENQPSPTIESATAQAGQQSNRYQQRPHSFNNQFSQNRFPSAQGQQPLNQAAPVQPEENQNGQVSNGFGALSQRPTSQPSIELTTPLEANEEPQDTNVDSAALNGFGSDAPNKRPESQFEAQANAQPSLTPSRPQTQAIGSQPQAAFPTQSQGAFAEATFGGNQPASQNGFEQNGFEQNGSDDAQFAPSTARPSFGQAQGEDDSYYYRQPAKPFNTPVGSRFPGAPSGQFNRVGQQPGQGSAQFPAASPQNSFQPQQEFNRGSSRFPQPSLAPTAPTGSTDDQYQGTTASAQFNGITQAAISPFQSQGSTRFPRPTLTPAAPTLASQFNGITQATASSFTSAAPFGSRPTFQQSPFNQPQPEPSKPFAQAEPESEAAQGSPSDVPTQQYNGEIYDYSKPPQGLPSPAQKEPASAPQRQNFPTGSQARPQFGSAQANNEQEMNMQQQPTRPTFGARPQFGAQPNRPQFGNFNRPQEQSAQDTKPQFSSQARPFAQGQEQPRPNCCKSLDSKVESLRGPSQNAGPAQNQFGSQFGSPSKGQGQFGSQFSGPEAGSQTFAGQEEAFGGPRKPPSFDQETGYHY